MTFHQNLLYQQNEYSIEKLHSFKITNFLLHLKCSTPRSTTPPTTTMHLKSHEFHKLWLKVTAVIIGSFAPVFFLGSMRATSDVPRVILSLLTLNAQNFDASTTRFVSAIGGGLLLGWGVMVWCLQAYVYDACPEGVRRSVVIGATLWYVLDSVGSVLSGNPVNALTNTCIILVAVGPLWKPATHTEGAATQPLVSS